MNNKNTLITAALVIIVGASAFYGGTIYEKSNLTKQGLIRNANNARGGNFAGAPNGQGQARSFGSGGNNPGGANANGGFLSGQVIAKDDKSITIKTRDGGSKIIFFSDSTQIGKSTPGSSADLNTGEQVMVTGTASPDGSIAAQNIQIRPDQPDQSPQAQN